MSDYYPNEFGVFIDESKSIIERPDYCPECGKIIDLNCDCDDERECQRCNEYGMVIVCIDDMCRGLGECVHGDGEMPCPDCRGLNKP